MSFKRLTDKELQFVESVPLSWLRNAGQGSMGATMQGFRLWCELAKKSGNLAKGLSCRVAGPYGKALYATYLKSEVSNAMGALKAAYNGLDNFSKIALARQSQKAYAAAAKKEGFVSRGCFLGADKNTLAAIYEYYVGMAPPVMLGSEVEQRIEMCELLTKELAIKGLSKRQIDDILGMVSKGIRGAARRLPAVPKARAPGLSAYQRRVLGMKPAGPKGRTALTYGDIAGLSPDILGADVITDIPKELAGLNFALKSAPARKRRRRRRTRSRSRKKKTTSRRKRAAPRRKRRTSSRRRRAAPRRSSRRKRRVTRRSSRRRRRR